MTENYDTDNDKALKNLLTGSLDHSVEHLDAHTLSRLSQARHRALGQVKRPRLFDSQWLKAASFAVLVVTVVNGWLLFSTPEVQQMNTDDFEILIANEDFELVQELDFVAWMIEEDHAS
jgi:hypothetical protein